MKNNTFLRLLALVGTMSSCTSTILPEPLDPEYVIVNGDTVKIRDDKTLLGDQRFSYTDFGYAIPIVGDTILSFRNIQIPKPPTMDLSVLRNSKKKNEPFRLIAIGGALAAGVRDYGLFNEGMVTSYPTILAHQMGVEFKLPLFDAEDFNGFERKVFTTYNPTLGPAFKVKNVVNNVDVSTGERGNFSMRGNYYEGETDNFARPFSLGARFKRYKSEIKDQLLKGPQPDFVIFEIDPIENSQGFGTQIAYKDGKTIAERDWEKYPNDGYDRGPFGGHKYDNLARDIKNRGIEKGVLVNIVPRSLRQAKEKDYSQELARTMEKYQILGLYPTKLVEGIYGYDYIKSSGYLVSAQTTTMDSLLSPVVNPNLKPGFSQERPGYAFSIDKPYYKMERERTDNNLELANKTLAVYSEYLGMPVFDLHGLYKAIHAGNYVTHDGVRVDPNYGTGNFFSTDRTTPSAFGQAVIANEVIKTINTYYKSRIPLVDTKYFLQF